MNTSNQKTGFTTGGNIGIGYAAASIFNAKGIIAGAGVAFGNCPVVNLITL